MTLKLVQGDGPIALLEEARRLVAAGISVIPIRGDGSKAPVVAWKEFQGRLPDDAELESWFGGPGLGMAIIGGAISGGLEILDFDRPGAHADWLQAVAEVDGDLADRVATKMPLVLTPSGGHHLYYRCAEIEGNLKLARAAVPYLDASGRSKLEIIETRGEGGYVLAHCSPAGCHASGNPYLLQYGPDVPEVPSVTPETRRLMLSAARSLTEQARPSMDARAEHAYTAASPHAGGERPSDRWAAATSWPQILEPHGWTVVGRRGPITDWCRPDRGAPGLSATTGKIGDNLYVFSTNTSFDPERKYSKFSAYGLLNHGGDYRAAHDAIVGLGYGQREPEIDWSGVGRETGGSSIDPTTGEVRGHAGAEPFPLRRYSGTPGPVRWVFKGLLEAGTVTILGAEPKAGKTWLTYDAVVSLATGGMLLDKWAPAEPGTTLYYSPEGGHRSRHARLLGLCEGRNLDPESVLPSLPHIDARMDLCVAGHASKLAQTIDDTGAKLVVIDPMVSAAIGIDENSTEVMRVLNPLRDIVLARPHCAMIVAHHTGKQARNQALSLGLRGSSAIGGWWDTLITLRRAEDDSSGPRRIDIAHRDHMAPEPLGFELEFGDIESTPWLSWFRLAPCDAPDVGKKSGGRTSNAATDKMMMDTIVALVGMEPGELTRGRGAKRVGLSRHRFNQLFKRLVDSGALILGDDLLMYPPTKN